MKPTVARIRDRDDAFRAAHFRDHFDPSRQGIVVDGREVGVLAVARRPDGFFVDNVQVQPGEQGRGLNGALPEDVVAEAFGCGLAASLGVNRVNRARRLHGRLGFRETGRTETHVLMMASPPADDLHAAS